MMTKSSDPDQAYKLYVCPMDRLGSFQAAYNVDQRELTGQIRACGQSGEIWNFDDPTDSGAVVVESASTGTKNDPIELEVRALDLSN